jgi:hypothetical protein
MSSTETLVCMPDPVLGKSEVPESSSSDTAVRKIGSDKKRSFEPQPVWKSQMDGKPYSRACCALI